MNLSNSLKKIITGIYTSMKRFPVTLLFSTSVAIMLIILSELSPILNANTEEILGKITMVLALGIPISLCARLYYERKEEKKIFKLGLYYLLGSILPILYYFFFLRELGMVSITRYVGVSLALYLCFIYLPYLKNRKNFEMYVIKIFTNFLVTYIYSAVLFLGLSAILFTIDKLLGIHMESETYYYTFLVVALVFGPAHFLSGVPQRNESYSSVDYPKIFKILLLYIVMPLLTAYTSILYLYFGKIIISMQWPIGLVSHLVLWYSLILTMVLFLIHPLKNENRWAQNFSKWAPRIVLPVLIMMFISMGIRIHAYGVTENRYYVFLLGLWIFAMMVYYVFTKNKKNIILPISLCIIVLLSVLGSLSSYSISKYSQNSRLTQVLTRNNMIEGQNIQTAPKNISKEDKQTISSILSYFENNHSLEVMKYLPRNFKIEDMEKVFGFPYESSGPYTHDQHVEQYFYFMRDEKDTILEISGYDYLIDARNLHNNVELKNEMVDIQASTQSNIVTIKYKGTEIYKKNFNLFAKELYEKYGFTPKNNTISPEEMIVIEENEHVKVQFVIMNIGGNQNNTTGDIEVNDLYFHLLIKIK